METKRVITIKLNLGESGNKNVPITVVDEAHTTVGDLMRQALDVEGMTLGEETDVGPFNLAIVRGKKLSRSISVKDLDCDTIFLT